MNLTEAVASATPAKPGRPQKLSLEGAYMSERQDELDESLLERDEGEDSSSGEIDGEFITMVDYFHNDEEHENNIKMLSAWDFPVWDFSKARLIRFAVSMYHSFGLMDHFQIPVQRFENFFEAVFSTSHDVPYHNYFHFFSVLQTSWLFAWTSGCYKHLKPTELLGMLTGAIGHDADHPGVTNAFLSNTKHPLAMLYNDISVLENHHCATTFQLLMKEENNIFCNLSEQHWKDTRRVMVAAILNTDMARHFGLLSKFNSMFGNRPALEHFDTEEKRQQIVSMIVHCADISTPIKPWAVSKRFADDVAKEFTLQVKKEESLNMNPTPHMLGLEDIYAQAKMEIGFINVFTWAAIEALALVLPNLQICFDTMDRNRTLWQDMLDAMGGEKPKKKLGRTGSGREHH